MRTEEQFQRSLPKNGKERNPMFSWILRFLPWVHSAAKPNIIDVGKERQEIIDGFLYSFGFRPHFFISPEEGDFFEHHAREQRNLDIVLAQHARVLHDLFQEQDALLAKKKRNV